MAHGWRTGVIVVRRNHLVTAAAAADGSDGTGSGGYLNYDRTSCTTGVDSRTGC